MSGGRWRGWAWFLLPVVGIALGLWLRSEVREVPAPEGAAEAAEAPLHPEVIRRTGGTPTVAVRATPDAEPVEVACANCHSLRPDAARVQDAADLDDFHQGLRFEHGNLSCQACHNMDNHDTLRLSDGTAVPFTEVLRVCSQCHPEKAVAYAHGAHGGMNGHWDRTQGPRLRNSCVHCHHPHTPAYPTFQPAPGPTDLPEHVGGDS